MEVIRLYNHESDAAAKEVKINIKPPNRMAEHKKKLFLIRGVTINITVKLSTAKNFLKKLFIYHHSDPNNYGKTWMKSKHLFHYRNFNKY